MWLTCHVRLGTDSARIPIPHVFSHASLMSRPVLNLVLIAFLASFQSSCKSAYYSTMEKFGQHKRDILVSRVDKARESQEDAQEQFKTTLESFKELTNFDGGELETLYNRLNKEYERSEDRAGTVKTRIESIKTVSGDMFREWEEEIERDIADPKLARKSRELKADSEDRYEQMIAKMEAASVKMDPVLTSFKSHVTFLKHNLNAQAITSLKDTVIEIEDDVASLIEDMQVSIDEANSFIESMES